jgi:hypothetical protein
MRMKKRARMKSQSQNLPFEVRVEIRLESSHLRRHLYRKNESSDKLDLNKATEMEAGRRMSLFIM